jgi:RsiW-degrading membrane proteinase PrsW (M82 family)
MVIFIALSIAILFPLLFLYLLRTRDLFATGNFHFVIVSMIWGVIAYIIASRINPLLINEGLADRALVVRVIGPILEELLKSLILIYLVQRADFNYVVDGAIYGFAAGIGFAVVENFEYVLGRPNIAIALAVARVFSTNLIHAAASGVIGVALSARRAESGAKGIIFLTGGYIVSIIFHMMFNTMVSAGAILAFAVVFGAVGVGVIYLAIRRGLSIQKEWFGEKLNELNRVTKNEVRALNRIEELNKLLGPLALQFGEAKADKVRTLLSRQAEIGIKTKLLDTTVNKDKREEMHRIIEDLRAEMETLRAGIGPYCMLFVRQVYLAQDMNLWGTIHARIAEAGTGQKGGGLWDLAASRVQSSRNREEES